MKTTYNTRMGGTVTLTPTGLIHRAGTTYSGKIAQAEAKEKPVKK